MKKAMLPMMLLCAATLFEAAAQQPEPDYKPGFKDGRYYIIRPSDGDTLYADEQVPQQYGSLPQYPIVLFHRGEHLLLSMHKPDKGDGPAYSSDYLVKAVFFPVPGRPIGQDETGTVDMHLGTFFSMYAPNNDIQKKLQAEARRLNIRNLKDYILNNGMHVRIRSEEVLHFKGRVPQRGPVEDRTKVIIRERFLERSTVARSLDRVPLPIRPNANAENPMIVYLRDTIRQSSTAPNNYVVEFAETNEFINGLLLIIRARDIFEFGQLRNSNRFCETLCKENCFILNQSTKTFNITLTIKDMVVRDEDSYDLPEYTCYRGREVDDRSRAVQGARQDERQRNRDERRQNREERERTEMSSAYKQPSIRWLAEATCA